jgi:FG-GAP repeat protein
MSRLRTVTSGVGVLVVAAGIVLSRAWVRAPQVERPLPPSPAAPEHPQPDVLDADFSPATAAEARAALGRAFGDALEAPVAFAVGDFNGDGSPDLAAAVRARAGRAAEINDGLANWTVQACDLSPAPRGGSATSPPAPVSDGERLVALVHGYGRRGWRDFEARQAYLVRTVERGPWTPRPRQGRPDLDTTTGGHGVGDVLEAPEPNSAVLYWTGGRYACRPGGPPASVRAARP